MNTDAVLQHMIMIAKEAGAILHQQFNTPVEQMTKSTEVDIVTATDKQVEVLISEALLSAYPDTHLVGEEGGGQGASAATADYLWFVDPLDGTTNFASSIPHFCTSIALTDNNRVPLLGVIYDPMRDELYTARRGAGATLNGNLLAVTEKTSLSQSVLASGFAYDRRTNSNNNTKQWTAFIPKVRGLRRMGAAALDLAYVAAGRYDGYWERSLNPWDVMAGVLLITEAGGIVTDYQGGDSPQFDNDGRYVASNGHIHAQILDVLAETYSWS